MAKETRQIGTILKCGPLYQARPLGQPGQIFSTSGEARSFFRRFSGQDAPVAAGQKPVQAASVSFVGDLENDRMERVFLTASFAPPPPSQPEPPFLANVTMYLPRFAYDSGTIYWEDLAKTEPATTPGVSPVRDWRALIGTDMALVSGTPGTLAVGGGVAFPAGGAAYRSTTGSNNVFTVLVCCDPNPAIAYESNFVLTSSSNEVSSFVEANADAGGAAFGVGGDYILNVTDDKLQGTRGISVNGTAARAFTELTRVSDTVLLGTYATYQMGTANPTFFFKGTVRSFLAYNIALDDAQITVAMQFLASGNLPPAIVDVIVPIHYEGQPSETLIGAPLTAMLALHAAHPDVPLTQCLSPSSYYTLGLPSATVTARINANLKPTDERAMHAHGQFAWITASGTTALALQTYSSTTVPSATGYDTLLNFYSQVNFTTVATFGRQLLLGQGFQGVTTFLAGGFMIAAPQRVALVASGFTRDLSPVPPSLTSAAYIGAGLNNLQSSLAAEYPTVTPVSQPSLVGGLTLVPSNASILEYNDDDVSLAVLIGLADVYRSNPTGPVPVFSTATHYGATELTAMNAFLTRCKAWAASHNVTLRFKRANQINAA